MKMTRIIVQFALLLFCCGQSRPVLPEAQEKSEGPNQSWYSFFLAGQKIGYAVYAVESLAEGFRFESLSRMSVGMMGSSQTLRTRSVAITGRDLVLKSFEFSLSSQERSFSARGRVKGSELLITERETGQQRSIPVTGPVYPIEALGRVVVRANQEPGRPSVYKTFDGAVMDVLPCEVTVIGPDSVTVDGKKISALKVRTRRAKLTSTNWLTQDGTSLLERTEIGLEALLTSQEQALAGEAESAKLDILALFRVKVDTVITEPERVKRLVVEVSGVDTADFRLAGPNQRLIAASPLTLEITTPQLPEGPVRLPAGAEREFLKPSVSIQSDDAQIRRRAAEVVGRAADGREAAQRLMEWVYRSLKKEATASFPNAKDVLRHMAGDCNEHAVLYAALARAAGIPTKVVAGLVYMDGAFYYHAWNEVFLERWVPVDATFGQFPASAARLRIVEGDMAKQAEVLGVVQKIGLRVRGFD